MAKKFGDMAAGMEAYFLAQASLTNLIEQRFWKVGDPSFIALYESLNQEPAASQGQFITYRHAGTRVDRLLGSAETKLRFAGVEMRCYARYASDAEALRDTLLAVIGMGFVGTWTGSSTPAVTIKNAHWSPEGEETDFDETFKMSFATALLLVPYLND